MSNALALLQSAMPRRGQEGDSALPGANVVVRLRSNRVSSGLAIVVQFMDGELRAARAESGSTDTASDIDMIGDPVITAGYLLGDVPYPEMTSRCHLRWGLVEAACLLAIVHRPSWNAVTLRRRADGGSAR